MKTVQSLLNVIAGKKPRQVFTAKVGNKRIRGVEQEFVLESGGAAKGDAVKLEYVTPARLPSPKNMRYISVKQASDKYKIAQRTVQDLCHGGKVVGKRQGSGENAPWLVGEESLRAYLKTQR